ncbi:MAG: hypothetical protein R2779_00195 [Crocinitomicaceae bacterium]
MRRKQIKQFTNMSWFPQNLKKLMAEFLSWFVLKVNASKPFIPVINKTLEQTGMKKIIYIDLQIGAGLDTVQPFIDKTIEIKCLDIKDFNTSDKGLYLFVNSFHQLSVEDAKSILKNISESKNPIVVVEGNNDSLWQIVGMTFFVPMTILFASLFVKPFRFQRIIFTYLIPILPIVTMIDGCIALLKLYNPSDLKELTSQLNNYTWEMGKNDNGRGGKIIYLTGINNE